MSSFAWVVISKTINDTVPNWFKTLYHQRLRQRNPNIVNNKKSTLEVIYFKIINGSNRLTMFAKAFE